MLCLHRQRGTSKAPQTRGGNFRNNTAPKVLPSLLSRALGFGSLVNASSLPRSHWIPGIHSGPGAIYLIVLKRRIDAARTVLCVVNLAILLFAFSAPNMVVYHEDEPKRLSSFQSQVKIQTHILRDGSVSHEEHTPAAPYVATKRSQEARGLTA